MAAKTNGWTQRIVAGLIVVLCGAAVIGSVSAASQTKVNDSRIDQAEQGRIEIRGELIDYRKILDERLQAMEAQLVVMNLKLELIRAELKQRSER